MRVDELYTDIINQDGTVKDKTKLKEILEDYLVVKDNLSKINEVVTQGLLTKSHYPSDTVISVYESLQKHLVNKNDTCEDIVSIVGEDSSLSNIIKEYFGKD